MAWLGDTLLVGCHLFCMCEGWVCCSLVQFGWSGCGKIMAITCHIDYQNQSAMNYVGIGFMKNLY